MCVEIVCLLFYFLFVVETWNIESVSKKLNSVFQVGTVVPMIGDIVVAQQVVHIFLILKELFILKVLLVTFLFFTFKLFFNEVEGERWTVLRRKVREKGEKKYFKSSKK